VTATQGFITSGILLFLGIALLVTAQQVLRPERVPRVAAILLGGVLCVGGALWLLLSIAAYRGES
jgi:hypothetical protein